MLAQLAANKISTAPRVLSVCYIRKAGASSTSKPKEPKDSHSSSPTPSKSFAVAETTDHGSIEQGPAPPSRHRVLPPDDGRVRFPNVWDLALNKRRYEYAMKYKGYDDPWDMMPVKRIPNSSPENANLLPSAHDKRLIGCICNEDVFHIKWMFVHKGEPKRCYCGHWFKIVERTWPDLTDFGMTPDMLKPQAH